MVNVLQNKGFSILELMIAVFIFSIAMLGLLSSVSHITVSNIENMLRNEAVKVSEQCISMVKDGQPLPASVTRTVGSISKDYTITQLDNTIGNLRQVRITISWNHKGKAYQHTVTTLVE